MNKVILLGRLARDPEVRYTQSGKAVASFSLAINEGYGENKKVVFINIVAWDKLAETVGNHLSKGRQIMAEGRIQTRTYDDKNGQKRYVTEVVMVNMEFLGSKADNEGGQGNVQAGGGNAAAEWFGGEVMGDEVPF